MSLFSSGEDEFGNEGAGVLSPSLKSSERSLSPPLFPATGEYVPSSTVAGKVENKEEDRKGEEEKKVSPVDETEDGKVETGKRLQESDTKSRIQAGTSITYTHSIHSLKHCRLDASCGFYQLDVSLSSSCIKPVGCIKLCQVCKNQS